MQSLAQGAAHVVLTGVSVLIVGRVLPGIEVKTFGSAVAFALVVAVLDVIAWKLLAPISWLSTFLTLGIGWFVINGVLFLLAARIVDGVKISGCFTAAIASFAVSFINLAMHALFGAWAP